MGGYYTLAEIEALLDALAAQYPAIVSPRFALGSSVEGRPIWAVKLSDHPAASEDEPRVLIDALHHAREPASMQSALLLLHRLADAYGSDAELTRLVDEREIFFVPCVNPDGYAWNQAVAPQGGGTWRKNRRPHAGGCVGVDLNRNYAFQWGKDGHGSSGDPCSDEFRGTAAGSEPEVAALDAFVGAADIAMVVSLHAHGRLMLHPLGHVLEATADHAAYREHGRDMAAWNDYVNGAVADVHSLVNGNALDHHHAMHGAEAWAFELGTSFWPPVAEMIEVAERNVEPLLYLVRCAGSHVLPVDLVVTELSGDGDGFAEAGETAELRVTLRNKGRAASAAGAKVRILAGGNAGSLVAVTKGEASVAAIPPGGEAATSPGALLATIAATTAAGTPVALLVEVEFDGRLERREWSFTAGAPRVVMMDAFESDLGWKAGLPGDTAFTGRWTRSDPKAIPQGLNFAQPEDDATPAPGTVCYMTGNSGKAAGQDDVDGGVTTLLTPVFDLASTHDPRVSLARWYWNHTADDPLSIDISNDGGGAWTNLESIIGMHDDWRVRTWRVQDHVAPTDRMRLRVVAQDPDNLSVTEALIDDFAVIDYGAAPHLAAFGAKVPGGVVSLQLGAPSAPPTAGPAQAVLFFAVQPGQVRVPGIAGVLGLDPASLVALGTLSLPAPGFAAVPLALPPDPQLVGQSGWFQALVHGGALAAPSFTNAVRVEIEAP